MALNTCFDLFARTMNYFGRSWSERALNNKSREHLPSFFCIQWWLSDRRRSVNLSIVSGRLKGRSRHGIRDRWNLWQGSLVLLVPDLMPVSSHVEIQTLYRKPQYTTMFYILFQWLTPYSTRDNDQNFRVIAIQPQLHQIDRFEIDRFDYLELENTIFRNFSCSVWLNFPDWIFKNVNEFYRTVS